MARSKTTFQPGVSGNPGGRPSTRRAELDKLLDVVWTPASRKRVIKKLVEDAESGDHEARTLLLAYTFGRPTERQEIGGMDGGIIEVAFIDYRTGIAGPAAGSDEDSDAPGEG